MNTIGIITLNLSLILYLFFYLPQLIHNFRYKRLTELSFGMHALLFIAATADLYYAYGRIHQWQYCFVSVMMFISIFVQHIHFFQYRHHIGWLSWLCLSLLIITLISCATFFAAHTNTSNDFYILMGWIGQSAYWTYTLPQIIKNIHSSHARSISSLFAAIGTATSLLDLASAWIFSWGSPSLYGGFIAIMLQSTLLFQCLSTKRITRLTMQRC